MRDVITALAVILLLALTAALAIPPFVDWDNRRAEVNERLSALLGRPVVVEGPIRITLLPTPSIKLGQIRLPEAGDAVSGAVARLKGEAALTPLLRGELRITGLRLDNADLSLRVDRMGAAPGAAAPALRTSLDHVELKDATLTLMGGDGAPFARIEQAQGALEATALDGPYRGSLAFTHAGARRTLRFTTGRIEEAGLRLRAMTENDLAAARLEFDGTVRRDVGDWALDGRVLASGNADLAVGGGQRSLLWRIEAAVKGLLSSLAVENVSAALGPTERQIAFAGSGRASLGLGAAPSLDVRLAARHADLDRILSDDRRPRRVRPTDVAALVGGLGGGEGPASATVTAHIEVGRLVLGGGVVSGARATLVRDAAGFRLTRVEGETPGGGRISFRAGAEGEGPLDMEVADLPALVGWLQGGPARPQPVRSLALSGRLLAAAGVNRVAGATIRADDMRFGGDVQLDTRGPRPLLSARLAAEELEIADLPDFGGGRDAAYDLALDLQASRVRYRGVGAGDLRARLRRDGERLELTELAVTDIGGANLTASAAIVDGAAAARAEVDALRLQPLIALAARLAPQPALDWLSTHAETLAPARLSLTFGPEPDGTRVATVIGSAGGMEVDGALRLDASGALAGAEAAKLDLAAPALTPVLRLLKAPAADEPAAGPVALALRAGALEGGASRWSLKGRIGDVAADVSGRWDPQSRRRFEGRLAIEGPDVSPIARALKVVVPRVPSPLPARLSSRLDLDGLRIVLGDLDARFGGAPVTGEIAFNLAEFGRVAGQLKTSRFDAGVVAPLIFGAPRRGAAEWSAAAYPPPAPISLPGDLYIEADSADLGGLAEARDARFVLRFDSGLLFLEHARGQVAGHAVSAQGTLRRSDAGVALSGRLTSAGGPSPLGGSFMGQIEFSALGDSPAQLIATLSGGGAAQIRGLSAPALARDAFDELTRTAGRGPLLSREAVATHLSRSATARVGVPDGEARVTLAGGMLRAGPVAIPMEAKNALAQLNFDLKSGSASARMAFLASSAPKGWNGPAPQAVLTWTGPPGAMTLAIDADELHNGLTALTIQRETERIEAIEQDQRERSFFNRRLRAEEEQRRAEEERAREAREAAARAERERAEQEKRERLMRAEQAREQALRAEQERLRQDNEARERDDIERARAERVRADRDERERLERARAERERLDLLERQRLSSPPQAAPLMILPPAAR